MDSTIYIQQWGSQEKYRVGTVGYKLLFNGYPTDEYEHMF